MLPKKSMEIARVEREKEFHNLLVHDGFNNRKVINSLASSFYSKTDLSPIWGPIWSRVDLRAKRVLDYGCGDGTFSVELMRRGALVEGIDISEGLVQFATQKFGASTPAPIFSIRDAHSTGFPDNSFDYVFGNGILHHLELEKAYQEIARVLKPGGRAFFMEAMDRHPLAVLFRKVTPAARSVDEQPLSLEQIEMARRFFGRCSHTEHYFTAVAAAPLHLASPAVTLWVVKALDRFDRAIMRVVPYFRRYAWQSMIELAKS